MLYFSDLKNKPVINDDKLAIGQLIDLLFCTGDTAMVSKLVIKSGGDIIYVPVSLLKLINHEVVIKTGFTKSGREKNELFIGRDLLDKQIIDIKGNKMVRVNDVVIGEKPVLTLTGVDVSALAILRWFGLEKPVQNFAKIFHQNLSPHFLSIADIQPLESTGGQVVIKTDSNKLERLRPEDLADYLETTNIKNVDKIINTLNQDFAAQVINHLNINYQTALFARFTNEEAAKILALIDPDETVDILLTLRSRRRKGILKLMPKNDRQIISRLLQLSKTPIGELINSDFLSVLPSLTVKQVIDLIRKQTHGFSHFHTIYVENQAHQLIGTFTMHELMLQDQTTPVYKFFNPKTVVVHITTPEEIAIDKMLKYKLQSLPVIDQDKHILGKITFDDVAGQILLRRGWKDKEA
jgi:CBS domain-containing protein/sporulation protein YlmC with PRC-barrel domain